MLNKRDGMSNLEFTKKLERLIDDYYEFDLSLDTIRNYLTESRNTLDLTENVISDDVYSFLQDIVTSNQLTSLKLLLDCVILPSDKHIMKETHGLSNYLISYELVFRSCCVCTDCVRAIVSDMFPHPRGVGMRYWFHFYTDFYVKNRYAIKFGVELRDVIARDMLANFRFTVGRERRFKITVESALILDFLLSNVF